MLNKKYTKQLWAIVTDERFYFLKNFIETN